MRSLTATLRPALIAACLVALGVPALADTPSAPTSQGLEALQAAYVRAVKPGEMVDHYRNLFVTLLQRVQRSYATDIDLPGFIATATRVLEPMPEGAGEAPEVFRKAINTALRGLDPNSRYLDAQGYANERADSAGSFVGVGLELEHTDEGARIMNVIAHSPAERARLQKGDVIVRVDDHDLKGQPLSEATTRMRGKEGTSVSLTVRRIDTDGEMTVALTRETIRRQTLAWSMEGDVLVLRLRTFTGPVGDRLEAAIEEASATQAPKGIVLDLRGNPGGLVREAVQVADAFLSRGVIMSMSGRSASSQRTRQADAKELLPGVPMVVMLDHRSASASELVAAALQDNGRAKVMGQRSFGKGSVQTTYALGDLGAVKLTTAFYHGPSGRTVHKAGVGPDIELVASGASQGDRAKADTADARPPRARIEQASCRAVIKAADPGLACAVGYLQAANEDEFLGGVAKVPPQD